MRIADIQYNDITNGEGVMLSLWLQGCPHRCDGCHNPETWNYEHGKEFTLNDFLGIMCNIDKRVNKNLAILGGEPLFEKNVEELAHFLDVFRTYHPNKQVYLWSGYTFEEILKDDKKLAVLRCIDVLIDGKYDKSKKNITLKLRGSENQRIIDVKKSLEKQEVILYTK